MLGASGCTCQPQKSVPSYARMSFRFRICNKKESCRIPVHPNNTLFTVVYVRASAARIYCCVPITSSQCAGRFHTFGAIMEPGSLQLRTKGLLGRFTAV